MYKKTQTLLIVLCLGLFSPLWSQSPKVTGIFSTLEFNEEGGDLNGEEVFLFFSGEYWALYQESIGEPMVPQLVKVKINKNKIEFTVKGIDDKRKTFKGEIKKDAMTGKFDNQKELIRIPRKKSYWQ